MENTPPLLTPSNPAIPGFDPVETRARHDGWTPARQLGFIEALAKSACVTDAAKSVGMSTASAYELRNRNEAKAFRVAWDVALSLGVRQLGDAVISRALHGEAIPVFYKGEQVGERIRFDNRLAQFVLRTHDPMRFGAWIDSQMFSPAADPQSVFARATNALFDEAHGAKTPHEFSVETYLKREDDPDYDPDDDPDLEEENEREPDACDNEDDALETVETNAAPEVATNASDNAQHKSLDCAVDPDARSDAPLLPVVADVEPEPATDANPIHFRYYPPAKPRLIRDMAPGTPYSVWEDGEQKTRFA